MRDAAGEAEYHYVLIDYVCKVVSGELRAGDDVSRATWVREGALRRIPIDRGHARRDRKASGSSK